MPEKGNADAMFALKVLMEKHREVQKKATLCIRRPGQSLRPGSERRVVVLCNKIRNNQKICATCTGYIRGKRNSGE